MPYLHRLHLATVRKPRRLPQNRKYATYCNVSRDRPSQGHKQQAHKIWCGFWEMWANWPTDIQTRWWQYSAPIPVGGGNVIVVRESVRTQVSIDYFDWLSIPHQVSWPMLTSPVLLHRHWASWQHSSPSRAAQGPRHCLAAEWLHYTTLDLGSLQCSATHRHQQIYNKSLIIPISC